jgi:TRAP-type C4-dicarboxylate transport system permease small subunit
VAESSPALADDVSQDDALNAFARFAARAVDTLAIATFAGMFGCVVAQVVFRYFLASPLTWSDELARYLFVWCAFLGWIVAARRHTHLGVDVVATRLPARGAAALRLVGALAAIAFAAVLAFYGTRVAARNLDVETTALFFTMGVVYAIVPAAAIAVGLHAVADASRALATLTGPSAP